MHRLATDPFSGNKRLKKKRGKLRAGFKEGARSVHLGHMVLWGVRNSTRTKGPRLGEGEERCQ